MKTVFTSLIFITALQFSNLFGQNFNVVFLIDKVYEKTFLNQTLENMNAMSLIGEDNVKFKMISNSENQIKLSHDNDMEGKDQRKCEVIGMAGVRCNPCKRLDQERKNNGQVYAVTSDSDFGTCNMNIDDYKALSLDDDLMEILKEERKKAKKSKEDYTVVFWIPSNETVSVDLVTDNTSRKVDFGTLVNFTAKTNSKESIPVIMKVNDELIDECKDNGVTKINRSVPLVKQIEITETTIVTLEGKGCGETKDVKFELNEDCNEIEKVIHEATYSSKVLGPLGKKIQASATLDGVACTEVKLVDNKLYIIVLNKQCGVREFRAELEDVQTHEKFTAILRKSTDQALVHLNSSDQKNYMVFTLNHDDLKSKGVFDLRSDESEPKYKMRIVPTESVKDDLDISGKESSWINVKFQKCN